MMRLVLCVLLAVVSSPAQAQPLDCSADEHCPNGFYCGSDLHFCRECINCKDLNREPPKVTTSCIKSVAKCGPCFKGMVDDRWGDSNASCVLPGGREEAVLPIYVWIVIALGVLLVAVIIVVLLLRNTDTFNIKACTRTSVESPCPVPSASAPPPPYTDYPFVPAASPAPSYSPGDYDETSCPLVKREPAPAQVPEGARESEGSQEARVFNNPVYVRTPHLPPSYEAPSVESDHEAPFVPIDEETMESPWTPNVPATDNTSASDPAGASASSSEVAAEATSPSMAVALRRQLHPDAPPAKILRQDTNNNRNRADNGSGNGNNFPSSAPGAGAGAPSFVINVLNVNTVQQLSDIKL